MLKLIAFLLRASRGVIVLSVLAGLMGAGAGVGLIALIQRELARDPARPDVVAVIWMFAALCVLSAVTRVTAQLAMIRLGQGAVAELGVHLVRRTLTIPLRAFESLNSSAILATLTEDIAILAGALVSVPHLCINIPILIACVAYAGWLSPLIMACGIFFATLGVGTYVAMTRSGVRGLRRARARQDAVVGHFRTAIGGFRELKQHSGRRAAFLTESLEPDVAAARAESVRALSRFAIADGWSQLAIFAFIGFLLYGLPRLTPIDRPILISCVFIVLYLIAPLDFILTWLPALGRARASLFKIESLLPEIQRYAERESATQPSHSAHPETVDSVSLVGAAFHYHDGEKDHGFSLGPLELTLRRGEIVIVAGGNGSGKTTLVKVLSGLYRPDAGVVRVDDRAVCDDEAEAYRQLFSVVFADGYLFGDLRGLGSDAINEEARSGLERLGLTSMVSVADRVFSTLDLSHGQRRRLALLTAWLEDRPFCILDEWAANQDPTFKKLFYSKLLPEMKAAGKGVLVISHDDDYFEVADRVLRLRDGRVFDEVSMGIGGTWG
jgi:putative ATP-binding cassette transporter